MAPPPAAKGGPASPAPGSGVESGAQELDRIAAVVNDEVVLQSDVDEQVYLFLQRNNAQPDSALVDTLRRQVLDQMISEKLIVAEAKRQGLTVSPTEVERQVDQAIAEAHASGSAATRRSARSWPARTHRGQAAREVPQRGRAPDAGAAPGAEAAARTHDVTQAEAEAYLEGEPGQVPEDAGAAPPAA